MDVGPRYLETMGLTVLDGRIFHPARVEADRGVSIVVNQMMADAFGWENPVGRQVRMDDTLMFRIIGVVKDFYSNGTWSKIEPMMMKLPPEDSYRTMAVRAKSSDLPGVLEYLREAWVKMIPNYPFEGMYQEDTLEEEKAINRSIKQLYIFLAIAATLLSMIGLYTLISLSILNRTKEIGIRKVNGALVSDIVLKLNFDMLKWILISMIIASTS